MRLNAKVTASLKDSLGDRDENGEEQKLSDKDDDDLRQYPTEYDDRDEIETRLRRGKRAGTKLERFVVKSNNDND